MKSLVISFFLYFFWISAFTQAPHAFKYQAVVHDTSGEVMAGKNVNFKISILRESATGTTVYSELHSKTTNAFGLVDLEIGEGTSPSGTFSGIDWSSGIYYIRVEMDPEGGASWQLMGTNELLSVPYALHAKTVENDQVNDADADPANEFQMLIISNDSLYLTNPIRMAMHRGTLVTRMTIMMELQMLLIIVPWLQILPSQIQTRME